MPETTERQYRLRDVVRVVREGKYTGQTGKITHAEYDRSVPLVVDVPGSVMGICFNHADVELVEAAPDLTLEDDVVQTWKNYPAIFFDEMRPGPDRDSVARLADLVRRGPDASTTERPAPRDLLLGHLVARALTGDDCELVGFSGAGRCLEEAIAMRWDGAFTDLVCAEHAERAKTRGALVVYPIGTRSDAPTDPDEARRV